MATNTENSVPVGDSAYEVSQGSSFNLLPASIPSKICCGCGDESSSGKYKCDYKKNNHWFCDGCYDLHCSECCYEFGEECPRKVKDTELCEKCFVLGGGELEEEDDDEEDFPEKGRCGRCGEDNGKGGTELWCDLCDDCDGGDEEDDEDEEEDDEDEEEVVPEWRNEENLEKLRAEIRAENERKAKELEERLAKYEKV
jgi:hypothetical protein